MTKPVGYWIYDMINVYRILENTGAEGPGKRFCIWLQGCSRHCEGCFAKDTWSFEPNKLFFVEELAEKILKQSDIEGITVLGGEPFEQAEELSRLLKIIHSDRLSVLVFTGFKYEEILSADNEYFNDILLNTDVLIDGEFIQEKKNFLRPLAGSENQRFIFLTNRYTEKDFKKNRIEIRISTNGMLSVNGMGNFEKIKIFNDGRK